MLKKVVIMACIACCASVIVAGCATQTEGISKDQSFEISSGQNNSDVQNDADVENREEVIVKQSPDKYTWYVKDYVGMNLANVGYVSMSEDLRDSYGACNLKITPACVDGSFVDVSDKDILKEYVVVDQNLKPNTEIKLIFDKDDKGKEYESLVSYSSFDNIVLLVKKIDGSQDSSGSYSLTPISSSPSAKTRYVKDYVGMNLANVGYISMAGDLRDEYGKANIKIVPTSEDGSYVDLEDKESLRNYKIVSQSVAPNEKIKFKFDKEYKNLVKSQSLQQIEVKLEKLS